MDWRTSLTMRRSGTAWSTSSGNRPRLTSPSSCGRSASCSAARVGDLKRSVLRPLSPRVIPLVVLDAAVVYGGYAGALLLRFDADVPARSWTEFWQVTPFVAAAYVAANSIFCLYHPPPQSVNLIGGGLIFLPMPATKLWPHLNTMQFGGGARNGAGKRVLIVGA